MENLTKHQIVLLTLLVSFITSIATGIVTVALMNQAPIGVSQTINRVVEKTIETVVATSTPSKNNQTTIKETVVVSEDDQVVSAINKNTGSIVRIYERGVDQNTGLAVADFVGIGVVVSNDGTIATDNGIIFTDGKYFMKTNDGISYDLSIMEVDPSQKVALLKININGTSTPALSSVALASNDLQLGQAIVYIGGQTKNVVATGIISSLNTKDISASSTAASTTPQIQTIVISMQTSVPSSNLISGGLLFNLSGELAGIKSTYSSGDNLFAPASAIRDAISILKK